MRKICLDFYKLFRRVAEDCDLDKSTVSYCLSRLSSEGIQFWTVTLPKLSKSVLGSLELGYFKRPTDFAWKGRSLRYFRSLLDHIFLPDGSVASVGGEEALSNLRRLCEYTYKLALGFEPRQLVQSEHKYEQVQHDNRSFHLDWSWSEKLRRLSESRCPLLHKAHAHHILDCGPRFGPGAFAGSEHTRKPFYEYKLQPDRLIGTCNDHQRPFSGYFKPYPSAPVAVNLVNEGKTSEVLFVPKDSRGPRVISKEPLHQLRGQLAFFDWCTTVLEKSTRFRVNFASQQVNRLLALEGSLTKKWATFDLKECSDRVLMRLAVRIFSNAPGILLFLKRFRSRYYRLPSGALGRFSSIAGMGSGLTFPLMAYIVYLSAVLGLQAAGCPIREALSSVYVYGDDLIFPSRYAKAVSDALSKSGLKINHDKSFVHGSFRESCGADYFRGVECTPTRLKLTWAGLPTPRVVNENSLQLKTSMLSTLYPDNFLISLAKHAMELRKAAMFETAAYIESAIEDSGIPLPWVGEGSPVIGRYTDDPLQIQLQGRYNPEVGYSEIVAFMRTSDSSEVMHFCPYKFIASKIRPTINSWRTILEGSSSAAPFGVAIVPRANKVKKRCVSILAAFPAV